MKLQPLHDQVILKAVTSEEVTKSGIIIPDTAEKEKPEEGEVVAIGPGKLLENGNRAAMEVKTGDKVIFKKYSPDEIKVEGEEYLILKEEDILAIIK